MQRRRLAPIALIPLFLAPLALAGDPHAGQWRAVADRLIRTAPEDFGFSWGEGVQMIGLMKIHGRSRKEAYADYVEKWTTIYLPKEMKELLVLPPTSFWAPGYCGRWSPGTAMLDLYRARRKPEHLGLASRIAEFIRTGAERSPEGGLGHFLGSHQLWVDTLYMACPLLAGLGELQGKREYIDDAVSQIIVHARHLQDEKTGLFYHMWDWRTDARTPNFWGRGSGWVIMSLAETFEFLPKAHPSYPPLKSIAEKLARGLKATQDPSGMWHTVLEDPSSYAETSATAMAAYGLVKLVRLKVLPSSYRRMALRAWAAINRSYVKDAVVTGVSAGTAPKGGDYYRSVRVGTFTWGTGAYLMAGSEIDRLQ